MSKDTIAAIASGMTHGGIGVIRVSGNDAIPIVDTVFKAKKFLKIVIRQPPSELNLLILCINCIILLSRQ